MTDDINSDHLNSVCLYWGARPASPREFAERFAATLRGLGKCHKLLSQWNEQAMSYRKALRLTVEPTADAIEPLLTTMEPTEPTMFGYELMLWNGRAVTGQRCTLDVNGGKVPTIINNTDNHLLLDLPSDPAEAPTLYSTAGLAQIMAVLVRIWQPDSGVVMNDGYQMRHIISQGKRPTPGKPRVGWLTYLHRARLTGLPVADTVAESVPWKTVDVDGLGTLFIVADDHQFSVDNPEDVAHIDALTTFLDEHGALETIPTTVPTPLS